MDVEPTGDEHDAGCDGSDGSPNPILQFFLGGVSRFLLVGDQLHDGMDDAK